MNEQEIEEAKIAARSNLEKDARTYAVAALNMIKRRRGGKFKLSEAQFVKEMENIWIAGEFSAAERILRCIEVDPSLNSRDMIRGEIHLYILDVYGMLKKRLTDMKDLNLEDILWGKYSTEEAYKNFPISNEIQNQ